MESSDPSTQPTLEIELQSTPEIKPGEITTPKFSPTKVYNLQTLTNNQSNENIFISKPTLIVSSRNVIPSDIKKNTNLIEVGECPMWASEHVPIRNDQLRFIKKGEEKTNSYVNLDECKFIILGRSPSSCNYIFSHPTISRKHALLAHDFEGRLQIVDLNSMQGTFVDNRRIPSMLPITLNGGEKIKLAEDTSYLLVIKNTINQKIAQSLLEKKKSIVNSQEQQCINSQYNYTHITNESKEMEEYKEEVLSFFSHLNKTDALENDNLIQSTIDQLAPIYGSPQKKHSQGSRKRKLDQFAPNLSFTQKQTKTVQFKESVQRFRFSYHDDQIGRFSTDIIPINDLTPTIDNPTFSLSNIINNTKFSKFQQKQQENNEEEYVNNDDELSVLSIINYSQSSDDDSDLENERYTKRIKINNDNNNNNISSTSIFGIQITTTTTKSNTTTLSTIDLTNYNKPTEIDF